MSGMIGGCRRRGTPPPTARSGFWGSNGPRRTMHIAVMSLLLLLLVNSESDGSDRSYKNTSSEESTDIPKSSNSSDADESNDSKADQQGPSTKPKSKVSSKQLPAVPRTPRLSESSNSSIDVATEEKSSSSSERPKTPDKETEILSAEDFTLEATNVEHHSDDGDDEDDDRRAFQPEFAEPILNLTVPMGRDATFRCLVQHLGGYRVGWVKADTKAIQAIHDHLITHNPRVSVSHTDHTTWNLHIHNVQEEDSGQYMCQINTDPMKSQLGSLDVVVPPDFISEETSGDIMVPEGGTVKLVCRARGHPEPHVQWRREDGTDIIIREPTGHRTRASAYQGETLRLVKISRSEMGAYMCIASNGVPPTVSKRIMVNVQFPPVIQVPNQLVGAPLGTDVTLECYVEASPKSINYWVRDTGEMVISSYQKYDVQLISKSMFEVRMAVIVRNLQRDDIGSYRCIAKNSLGEVESNIRLYEIPGATHLYNNPHIPPDEEDYGEQFGSAEHDQDGDQDQSGGLGEHMNHHDVTSVTRGGGSKSANVHHGVSVTSPRGHHHSGNSNSAVETNYVPGGGNEAGRDGGDGSAARSVGGDEQVVSVVLLIEVLLGALRSIAN